MKEEALELRKDEEPTIPLSVWTPAERARGVVLIGHGLGADRSHPGVQIPAEYLVERLGIAVVAPDLPEHGARSRGPRRWDDVVAAWQAYWSAGGAAALRDEWLRILDFARERFAGVRAGYFGLSLGTQYGVVFLAHAPQIAAAALGLFGSEPPPKSAVMNSYAPRVRCPVYFVQKQDDEIHSRESTDHLFASLASAEKELDSSPGRHTAVTPETLRRACDFVARHL
jgi:dienelactone hydrolase